jgi:peptide/nickel transport system permease protein
VGAYALKRVVCAAALFLALATVTFVLLFVLPHTDSAPGRRRAGVAPRPPLDIHGSVVHEYGQFLSRIAHGALGTSSVNGHEVTTILTTAAPITAGLVLGGAVLWMLVALPLGLIAALRPQSLTAKAGGAFTLLGLSVHPLWLGLVLSWVFGDQLGWFPPGGYCDTLGPQPECGGPLPWAYHMALPWTAFALLYGALYVRLIRANAAEALRQDHVLTARAKGVPDWGVLRSHVLAATVRPVLSALVLDVGGLAMGTFGAAIFVEVAFGIPGLGRTAAQSFQRHDLPVIIGILLFVTTTVVVANLVADLAAAVLDPRVRRCGARA